MSRFMLALAALMFLDGCVTHSVTLTSFTPSEEMRREILAQVKKSSGDDLITKLQTNGYKCRIVRGEDFETDRGKVGVSFDYILCEKPNLSYDPAVSQAAIELDGNSPTGRIFVNSFVRVFEGASELDLEDGTEQSSAK